MLRLRLPYTSTMSQELKMYIQDVLNGKNLYVTELYKDVESRKKLNKMVIDLNISKSSLKRSMQIIASKLFKNSPNRGHITSFLLFSMELDSHLSTSTWYKRDMLIDLLHKIFLSHNIQPNKLYKQKDFFWGSPFIFFSIIFLLIIFIR